MTRLEELNAEIEAQRAIVDQARWECARAVNQMAIQIIAQDRRIAQAAVDADRREAERRHELQFSVVRETKASW